MHRGNHEESLLGLPLETTRNRITNDLNRKRFFCVHKGSMVEALKTGENQMSNQESMGLLENPKPKAYAVLTLCLGSKC